MPAFKDITGERFGRLTVLRVAFRAERIYWFCQCDCGQSCIVSGGNLRTGQTKSCKCLHTERAKRLNRKHGHYGTPAYRAWSNMLQRCSNLDSTAYPNYGGRGITACERWRSFENFLADMGEPPPGLTLERTNNDLGYFPDNCRWATRLEQAHNKRRHGHEKLTPQQVLSIRKDTRFQRQIAQAYGIAQTNVSMIKRRKTWRHL